ncbi:MAG: hypothetical protein M3112_07590 [Actinomycetia bacterium]|nr:hypothetical protein [Actinomycetes bacterium]
MIRRIITTMTLAGVVTIALASAAPILAATPTCLSAGACTVDTGSGSIPSPDLDWNAGGLPGARSSSESKEPQDADRARRMPRDTESPTGRARKGHLC